MQIQQQNIKNVKHVNGLQFLVIFNNQKELKLLNY